MEFPEKKFLKDLSCPEGTEENKALVGATSLKFSGKLANPATTFPVWISTTNRSRSKEIRSVGDFCGIRTDCLDVESGYPEEARSPRRTQVRGQMLRFSNSSVSELGNSKDCRSQQLAEQCLQLNRLWSRGRRRQPEQLWAVSLVGWGEPFQPFQQTQEKREMPARALESKTSSTSGLQHTKRVLI